ncbi:MAG: 16S rRNA (guanine(527)-N(7))-methyltransferase RsmG [Bacteroidia bacterium]|nr:16S rRNA (guanine(527)-N(7))-methyltransferase RsmG [Bacteroidia bacterium]
MKPTFGPEIIKKYFPELSEKQFNLITALYELYLFWNDKINVISRKDFPNFYLHHVLHSLSIAKFFSFHENQKILDVGTGGGFPGIPLAIYFENADFTLTDSIGKKITVVREISHSLKLSNVEALCIRVEAINRPKFYDYVISRAVAPASKILNWTKHLIKRSTLPNQQGYIFLKGGDIMKEFADFSPDHLKIIPLHDFFEETFFVEKKIIFFNNQK